MTYLPLSFLGQGGFSFIHLLPFINFSEPHKQNNFSTYSIALKSIRIHENQYVTKYSTSSASRNNRCLTAVNGESKIIKNENSYQYRKATTPNLRA